MERHQSDWNHVQLIRQATTADLPRMAGLAKEFYASSRMLRHFQIDRFVETWNSFISLGMGVIFLSVEKDEITGTIAGLVHRDANCDDLIAQEFYWFVHKDSRGEGIKLYRTFEDWAKAKGAHEIRMGYLVDSMPDKVKHFYQRLGFHEVETNYAKRLDTIEQRKAG